MKVSLGTSLMVKEPLYSEGPTSCVAGVRSHMPPESILPVAHHTSNFNQDIHVCTVHVHVCTIHKVCTAHVKTIICAMQLRYIHACTCTCTHTNITKPYIHFTCKLHVCLTYFSTNADLNSKE